MGQVISEIVIRSPCEKVYDLVTMPQHWPRWHPASVSVAGALNHSLNVGEKVHEVFNINGRRGEVTWTVIEAERPGTWAISGSVKGGGSGIIRYSIQSRGDDTAFSRNFDYVLPNRLVALLDRPLIRPRIQEESDIALASLREFIETRC